VATYHELIADIIAYLEGRREPLVNRLWRQLRLASERLDYERAARLRDAIRQVNQVTISQSLLTAAVERTHLVVVLPSAAPGAREVLLIVGGRLAAQVRLLAAADAATGARVLQAAWSAAAAALDPDRPLGQETVDEIAIISRWLYQNEGSPAIVPLPDDPTDPAAWRDLIERLPPVTTLTAEAAGQARVSVAVDPAMAAS
jgi:excinuclease UvrABC nuclease subunit